MTIHYTTDDTICMITIDRPEVANAVDRPTATALADAFRAFDADEQLLVAVLSGANGTFCAGNDLKSMQVPEEGRAPRVAPDGDGPMGPTPHDSLEARYRRDRRLRGRRRTRAGGLV